MNRRIKGAVVDSSARSAEQAQIDVRDLALLVVLLWNKYGIYKLAANVVLYTT